jgi:hypothetical protein
MGSESFQVIAGGSMIVEKTLRPDDITTGAPGCSAIIDISGINI